MSAVHVLYENASWLPPLAEALDARRLPWEAQFVDGGTIDLTGAPPDGIFVNRMSPSAHTRGHQGGVRYTAELLGWLEARGRRVLNGSRAFALEVSKVRQDWTLRAAGISTPDTVAVVGTAGLRAAARRLGAPFVTKHNQGGKGLGVVSYRDLATFDAAVDAGLEQSPDGVTLLQRYIEPRDASITRVEIVGHRFLYALRSSTEGGFELCPADACAVDDAFCPVGEAPGSKFRFRPEITADDPLIQALVAYTRTHALDVAGIEYVEDRDGNRFVYDVNANSNFNAEVEAEAGVRGMVELAGLCEVALARPSVAAK
ncbi:MAG: alpha-L-glutamate ligase [Myxococcota bacterium]